MARKNANAQKGTKVVHRNIEEEAQKVATPPQPGYFTKSPKGGRAKGGKPKAAPAFRPGGKKGGR